MSSALRNLWSGTVSVLVEIERSPQRFGILTVDRPDRSLLEPVERLGRRHVHLNALDLPRLARDTFEANRLAEPRHDVEVQVAGRRVVTHRRVVTEKVRRRDLLDARIVAVHGAKGALESFDVVLCRPDEQVEILGRTNETVHAHGRGAYQNVVQSLALESLENAEHLVAVHAESLAQGTASRPLLDLLQVAAA